MIFSILLTFLVFNFNQLSPGKEETTLNATPIPPEHIGLAYLYAPVHYQSYHPKFKNSDIPVRIDYDGDWNTGNNWENMDSEVAGLSAASYYSIVETNSHFFILYCFFHPRDYKLFFEIELQHENDLEGMLIAVSKTTGIVEAMVTRAHSSIHAYLPVGSKIKPIKDLKGYFTGSGNRVYTYQEAGGHGMYAFQPNKKNPKQDEILVLYPASGDECAAPHVKGAKQYELINIFEPEGLWNKRNNPEVFATYGNFHNTKSFIGGANAPWMWSDKSDPDGIEKGDMALDPANLLNLYFEFPGMDTVYTYNPYQAIY